MFSTKPANSLRSLFSRYHEPPGLSKKQSEKLLDGLKQSFRKELDREYGHADKLRVASSKKPSASQDNRHSAATHHLNSILTNPLFSYNKTSPLPTSPIALEKAKPDPMQVFDQAVSRGLMNIAAATGCLISKQAQLKTPEIQSAATAAQDVASRVVRWLRSSGAEANLDFLDKKPFVKALVPFLVAEQMEDKAWEWISRALYEAPSAVDEGTRILRASFLLAQVVQVKSQPQYGNLDAAITTILEAEELFKGTPQQAELLVLPWRSVSWLSTVESYGRTLPSEKLFDAHLEAAKRLPQPLVVERAHLHLHHPTHPDHGPALHLFRNEKQLKQQVASELLQKLNQDGVNTAKLAGIGPKPWITYLGADTVNFLTKSGMSQQASDLKAALFDRELGSLANILFRPPQTDN